MTTIQLNAELYRAMGEIADDKVLLKKVLDFVKSLTPAKNEADDAKTAQQKAYVKESLTRALNEVEAAKRGEVTMMTEEEFLEGLKKEGIG